MLAGNGYGVLLFDRRGEGESEGDPNLLGWHGERDVHAAVKFLQTRPDVDPESIGGVGLSVGGEMMIAAGAESGALKAIMSEGASGWSVRDDWARGGYALGRSARPQHLHRRGGYLREQPSSRRPRGPRAEDLRAPPSSCTARRASRRRSQPTRASMKGSGLQGDLGSPRLWPYEGHRGAAAGVRAAGRRVLRQDPPR